MEQPPKAEGMVIRGLSVVHAGFKTYLGVVPRDMSSKHSYVELKDAIELGIQRGVTPEGKIQEQVQPLNIFPYMKPAAVKVRYYSIIVDVSTHEELTKLYRACTGASGLFIPGMG